jgi:hypothetical protein
MRIAKPARSSEASEMQSLKVGSIGHKKGASLTADPFICA